MVCFGADNRRALVVTAVSCLVAAAVLSAALLLLLAATDDAKDGDTTPYTNYRLSNHTIPQHYNITLTPLLHTAFGSFEGQVDITVNILRPTKVIYLHARAINITDTRLEQANESLPLTETFAHEQHQYWVIRTEREVSVGTATISLTYEGILDKYFYGFYRSSYDDSKGNTRYLVTTKFEPTYARMAFPCFDEPNKKARFSITLVHPTEYPVALSNMPAKGPAQLLSAYRNDSDYYLTAFETTKVPMSTYLVAFVVCDFAHQSAITAHGRVPVRRTVRTFAPPELVAQTSLALDIAVKTLDVFDDYFGIPYTESFPKLDMIAIPDFQSGAMENWGLVTFKMPYMLYEDNSTTIQTYVYIGEVVCHELAHMWFGNVVTMDWWDDLWLNEGFATFMAYEGMDKYSSQWHADTELLERESFRSMREDSYARTHPVIQPVFHPREIAMAFDIVTYGKGASLLRMLSATIGPENFRRGIQNYLRRFKYSNAKTDDLWHTLGQTANYDVKALMDNWTLQKGYPIVQVDADSGQISQTLFQSKFDAEEAEEAEQFQWQLNLKSINFTDSTQLHNPGQIGFYRVNYTRAEWLSLIEKMCRLPCQCRTAVCDCIDNVADRVSLLENAFQLAFHGHLSYDIPFRMLTKYLPRETEVNAWVSALHNLKDIGMRVFAAEPRLQESYKRLIWSIVAERYDDLGWTPSTTDSYNEKKLRWLVMQEACACDYQPCLDAAAEFREQQNSSDVWQDMHPSLKRVVDSASAKQLPAEDLWEQVGALYHSTPGVRELYRVPIALINDTTILQQFLDLHLASPPHYSNADIKLALLALAERSVLGVDQVWHTVTLHWHDINAQMGTESDKYWFKTLSRIWAGFTSQKQLQQLEAFFAEHPADETVNSWRLKSIQQIQFNVNWLEAKLPEITEQLRPFTEDDAFLLL